MGYIDLSTLHSPVPRAKPPASWGAQIRDNFDYLYSNRRQVCTSATRPTGVEGLEIYETDTDKSYQYNGTSWVEVGGIGGWTTWTPTLTQSGTVTKTVTYARYFRYGKLITFQAYLVVTGSGTISQVVNMSLPVTAAQSGMPCGGTFYIYDASAGANRLGHSVLTSTTTVGGLQDSQANFMGAAGTFTAALASSDSILVAGTYEAA